MGLTQVRKKILLTAIVVVLLLVGVLIVATRLTTHPLKVVATNPQLNNISNITPFLKIDFNETVESSGLSVTGSDNIVKSFSASGNVVTVLLQNMQKNTNYSVTLDSAKTNSGSTVTNKTFSFKTNGVIYTWQLPKDQQKVLMQEQAAAQPKTDPILAYLPHATLDYYLSSTANTVNGQPQLVLQAQLDIFPGNLVNGSEADTIAAYKQQVLNYISSLGLNPAKYDIQYQVVTEQLMGH
jgi:hypothetical protein